MVSYKSIDLQTSLPRTAEMSQLAHNQLNRAFAEQAMLAQQGIRQSERQAQRTNQTESSAKSQISDRQAGGDRRQSSRRQNQTGGQEQQQEVQSLHPFKGKHIDFSL